MSSDTACRRRDRRFTIALGGAALEFVHPKPNGRSWKLDLIDLSLSGLSCRLHEELRGIEPGVQISEVTLRAGEIEVHGELLVMHVSTADPTRVCGALFYPASDSDMQTMHGFLAGMSLNQTG